MSPPSEGAIAISPPLGMVTDYPENIQLPKQLREYFFLHNEYGKRTKSLRLDRAVEHLRSFYDYIDRETRCSEAGIRIRDWYVRASPQALRLAGIFHLCENDGPSEGLISEREMDMVFASHWLRMSM